MAEERSNQGTNEPGADAQTDAQAQNTDDEGLGGSAPLTAEEQEEMGGREFGLMTYIVGGKAMTLEQLKAHQAEEERRIEATGKLMRADFAAQAEAAKHRPPADW